MRHILLLRGILLAVAAFALMMHFANAQPPEGLQIDPEVAKWFHELKMPDHPDVGCCDVSDCSPTEARLVNGHWEAIGHLGKWLVIPAAKIVVRHSNPMFRAVLCSSQSDDSIYCFVPPTLT